MAKRAQPQDGESITQQAKEQARHLASEAKDQTRKVAGQARDHVQKLVDEQKDQAAERLGSLAGVLRETGTRLSEGDQNGDLSRYADRAAEQVDRLSVYLRDNDLRGFVRDTESFARRRPEVFLGGALLAGLALARFLKASSPTGYDGGSRYAPTRSSYAPERRNPDVAAASAGTTPYNAPLGV